MILRVWSCALAIAAIVAVAYSNTFQCPFIFDDIQIVDPGAHIRPWPPLRSILLLPSRPLIGLSFALNYAVSGASVWSYHALNLVIHILAALILFGVVRRTLLSKPLGDEFQQSSTALAFAVALIWAVHPLITQAVTYIVQRCESLMGLFYLLTLYCAIRGLNSAARARWWYAGAITACAAGMLSKEVMVTAPLTVLLYDVLFESGSIRESLRKRWLLYSGLGATWILLGVVTIAAPVSETAGFVTKGMTSWAYLRSEFAVILHYLRLSVWPEGLVLDYAWPIATTAAQIIPYAVVVVALVGSTVAGLARRRPIGFLGAWFFLVLSVTSTVLPIVDLTFEHRMYLPLAAVVALFVIGGYSIGKRLIGQLQLSTERRARLQQRVGLVLATLIVGLLAAGTLRRNVDYQSDLVMWADVVARRPENGRGHTNLGLALAQRDRLQEALPHFYLGCQYTPFNAKSQHNLGLTLFLLGRVEEAKPHILEALRLTPKFAVAHYNLGRVLAAEGNLDESVGEYSAALQIDPEESEAYVEMGKVRDRQHRLKEAIDCFNSALRLQPDYAEAMSRLAIVLAEESEFRDVAEASRLAEKAVSLTAGQSAEAMDALATVRAAANRFAEAVEAAQRAAELASEAGDARLKDEIEAKLRAYRAMDRGKRDD